MSNTMSNIEEWLTYDYMFDYIGTHYCEEIQIENRIEYEILREETRNWNRERAYNRVKEWFLEEYPEVKNFGRNERTF